MDNYNNEGSNYIYAVNRVKKIKGFYAHLAIYVIINSIISIRAFMDNGIEGFKSGGLNFILFWGIGLLIHWFNTFGINFFLGKDWERKKINEFMDNKNKWE